MRTAYLQSVWLLMSVGMTCAWWSSSLVFAESNGRVREASGIVRHGDWLLIVDDEEPGSYYSYPLEDVNQSALRLRLGALSRFDIPYSKYLLDLEDIGVLADGRIVLLSERLRALVDDSGALVAEYNAPMSEVGGRGLEGLSIRRLENGDSEIAVLWEGGSFYENQLLPDVWSRLSNTSSSPVILVHQIPARRTIGEVKALEDPTTFFIPLKVPKPLLRPDEPFRAPALVWYERNDTEKPEYAFIVLLNSFEDLWLQRFDMRGNPIGKPYDFNGTAEALVKDLNWEGMTWFVDGESLLLVDDRGRKRLEGPPFIQIIPLPDDWRSVRP